MIFCYYSPNINLNHIVDKMQSLDIIAKLSIRTDEELISKAEELNNYYKKVQYELDLWGKKGWKIPDCERMLEKCRSKSPTNTLYLGLYHNHEWINRHAQKIYLILNSRIVYPRLKEMLRRI